MSARWAMRLALVAVLVAVAMANPCPSQGERREPTGKVRSQPKGQPEYDDMMECVWEIAPENAVPGEDCVQLTFTEFNTEDGYDALNIHGEGLQLQLSGEMLDFELPIVAASYNERMSLVFVVDESVGASGFIGEWELIKCNTLDPGHRDETPGYCPETGTVRKTEGVLRSQPEGQDEYLENMHCQWLLEPEDVPGHNSSCVELHVAFFDLEADFDTLYLISEGEEYNIVALTAQPFTLVAPVEVEFQSDALVQQGGFVLEYRAVECPSVPEDGPTILSCPFEGDRHALTGDITNRAENTLVYSPNALCTWTVRPHNSEGRCIHFKMDYFDLESGWDTLDIYGENYHQQLTGVLRDFEVVLRSNEMHLVFESDSMVQGEGFHGTYSTIDCPVLPTVETLVAQCNALTDMLGDAGHADFRILRDTPCCYFGGTETYEHKDAYVEVTCNDQGTAIRGLVLDSVQLVGMVTNMTAFEHVESIHMSHVSMGTVALPHTMEVLGMSAIAGHLFEGDLPTALRRLEITQAMGLTELPPLPRHLEFLEVRGTGLVQPPDMSGLSRLTHVDFTISSNMRDVHMRLPDDHIITTFIASHSPIGRLPAKLFNSTSNAIVSIECEDCGLTALPPTLPDSLRELLVPRNKLTAIPEVSPLLAYLDVGENMLTHMMPLPEGCELTGIDVSHNSFRTLPDLTPAHYLRHIALHNNPLERLPVLPDPLPGHDGIELLQLSNMGLTELPPLPPSLVRLDASDNAIDHLPETMPPLRFLRLSNNPIKTFGKVLTSMLQTLETFECNNCGLTALPFASWPPAVETVKLAHNDIAGELRVEASTLEVDVRDNQLHTISGVHHIMRALYAQNNNLTEVNGDSLHLLFLNVANNALPTLPLITMVSTADVSNNELASLAVAMETPPMVLNVADNKLQHLGPTLLARNELHAQNNLIADVARSELEWDPYVLNLANNRLTNWHVLSKMLSDTDDKSLVSLDVSHNELTDEMGEPLFAHPLPQLEVLDISHNKFTGPLPALRVHERLSNVFISESGFGTAFSAECRENPFRAQCVGPELEVVSWRRHASARFECAQLGFREEDATKTGRSVHVSVDWAQYSDHTMCNCTFGHYGEQGKCEACPVNGVCKGRVVVAQRGHYWDGVCTDAAKTHAHSVRKCRNAREHVCAPSNVFASEPETSVLSDAAHPKCADGYTGRLCGGCAANHFQWGAECRHCPHGAALAFLTMLVFALMGGLVYVAYKLAPGASGLFKIMLFFVQLTQLMAASGVRMQRGMTDVLEAFRPFMFNVPLAECFLQFTSLEPFLDETVRALVLPFDLLFIVLAVAGVGLWAVSSRGMLTEAKRKAWIDTNIRAFLLLLFIAYLRVASEVMDTMQCEFDACRNESFFVRAPHVSCDTPGAHLVNTWAWTMFFVYVLGIPALFLWIVWRSHTNLRDETVQRRYDFLFASYSDRFWYWEGLVFVRKLCIVMVLTLPKWDSALVPFFVLLVLILSTLLQYAVQPFVTAMDNVFEFTSLSIQCMLWSLLLVLGTPDVAPDTTISVLVSIAVMGVATAMVVFVGMAQRTTNAGAVRRVSDAMAGVGMRRGTAKSSGEGAPLLL